jgi:hypothetical protein
MVPFTPFCFVRCVYHTQSKLSRAFSLFPIHVGFVSASGNFSPEIANKALPRWKWNGETRNRNFYLLFYDRVGLWARIPLFCCSPFFSYSFNILYFIFLYHSLYLKTDDGLDGTQDFFLFCKEQNSEKYKEEYFFDGWMRWILAMSSSWLFQIFSCFCYIDFMALDHLLEMIWFEYIPYLALPLSSNSQIQW